MTAEEYRIKIDDALAGYFNVREGALNLVGGAPGDVPVPSNPATDRSTVSPSSTTMSAPHSPAAHAARTKNVL